METVISNDGTPIAYYRSGTGPPLVLVPGTGAANPVAWTAVLPALEEHFLVCAVDRRGHGASGDGPGYAIEREFEDIAAVVDSLGGPAHVLGHSFGGLCALEAALRTRNVRSLILYEPALGTLDGELQYPPGLTERLQTLLDQGDREAVLVAFYAQVAGLSPQEIEQVRSSPFWPERLGTAHTLPREIQAEEQYVFDPGRFQDLHVPTLILQGSDSPESLKGSGRALSAALTDSRIAVMPGQQHIAMYTAPELFLREVVTFLLSLG